MEEEEAVGAVARVELVDAAVAPARPARRRPGLGRLAGVGKVREQREMEVRIAVGEEPHFEVVEQRRRARASESMIDGHDDHRAIATAGYRRVNRASAAAAA